MALMLEEVSLLMRKGVCELFELPNLPTKPSEAQKKTINELEKQYVFNIKLYFTK